MAMKHINISKSLQLVYSSGCADKQNASGLPSLGSAQIPALIIKYRTIFSLTYKTWIYYCKIFKSHNIYKVIPKWRQTNFILETICTSSGQKLSNKCKNAWPNWCMRHFLRCRWKLYLFLVAYVMLYYVFYEVIKVS